MLVNINKKVPAYFDADEIVGVLPQSAPVAEGAFTVAVLIRGMQQPIMSDMEINELAKEVNKAKNKSEQINYEGAN